MIVIIAGDRNTTSRRVVLEAIEESGFEVTGVISGMAKGVDTTAVWVAEAMGVPLHKYPAEWSRYRRAAGPIRNQQMLDHPAEGLIAIIVPGSRGTVDMVNRARKRGIPVYVKSLPASRTEEP